ncbi:MAG TPA: hypothetical protein VD902_13945 [Symbiobacteriaceae bacterium]|nr:hypothetical protein [Symbiobacteriaceae bacterium]
MADTKRIEQARLMLEHATPLTFDCGTLCGHKCCKDDGFQPDQDIGVYLIPGELPLFDGTEDWLTWQFHSVQDYDFAPSWEHHGQIPFMQCQKLCRREKRPLECRTYPLQPLLHENGRLEMVYAPWATGFCPLTERYRVDELNPAFVEAAHKAWSLLLEEPEMQDHVRWLSDQIRAFRELPLTACCDDE